MARVNAVLLVLIILGALSVITSQHELRKVFTQLEAEQQASKKLAEEWTQLQLEQSTRATNKPVEAIASRQLGMRLPDPATTVIITPTGAALAPEAAGAGEKK